MSNPVPSTMPSNSSARPSENVTVASATDFIQGRTVIRPSATSGRYPLVEGDAGREQSDGSGRRRTVLLRASRGFEHGLRQLAFHLGRRQRLAGQGSVSGIDSVIGGHPGDELGQDVPLPPLGQHHACGAQHREFGGYLERADCAPRHEDAFAAVGLRASVVVSGDRARRPG